jgi:uracil-DNA glycosylase
MEFHSLEQEYSSCQRCPALCESRSQVVFGSGNKDADVLLIGEAPGANEDKQGIPFCGMSGKILDDLLESAGLHREDIFITNTILCHPPNNRNPTKEEVAHCSKRLTQLINVMQPKVIVTIGNFATDRIIGKTGIKSIHGKVFDYEGRKVVPVIHPASLLYSGRNPELLQQMKDDFLVVARLAGSKKEEKQKKQKKLLDFVQR